jgi:hypothetical protein
VVDAGEGKGVQGLLGRVQGRQAPPRGVPVPAPHPPPSVIAVQVSQIRPDRGQRIKVQTKSAPRPGNAPLPHRPAHPQSLLAPVQVIVQAGAGMLVNCQHQLVTRVQIPVTQDPNLPHLQLNGHLFVQAAEVQGGH